jgi:hypothetical protein
MTELLDRLPIDLRAVFEQEWGRMEAEKVEHKEARLRLEIEVKLLKEELRLMRIAAPLPAKIVEKGKLSNTVVVDVILKKYRDHTPLYRQSAILERDCGVEISRGTLCNGVMTAGQWLQAIRKQLKADLLSGTYIQADETPIGVQTPEKTGSNHRGYLWQYGRPGGPVVFDFQMGRGREGPKKFLGNFGGHLQSDGYSAYDKIGGKAIVFMGCMTHARRGFVDALKINPKESHATGIVEVIGALYAVEAHAREKGMSSRLLKAHCLIDADSLELLRSAMHEVNLSARAQRGICVGGSRCLCITAQRCG